MLFLSNIKFYENIWKVVFILLPKRFSIKLIQLKSSNHYFNKKWCFKAHTHTSSKNFAGFYQLKSKWNSDLSSSFNSMFLFTNNTYYIFSVVLLNKEEKYGSIWQPSILDKIYENSRGLWLGWGGGMGRKGTQL